MGPMAELAMRTYYKVQSNRVEQVREQINTGTSEN